MRGETLAVSKWMIVVASVLEPRLVLPASEYYDLVWVLIPFALARAAVRQARAQTAL